MHRRVALLAVAAVIAGPCLAQSARPVGAHAFRPVDAYGRSADIIGQRPATGGGGVFSRNDAFLLGAFVVGASAAAINDASFDSHMQASGMQRSGTLRTLANGASAFGDPGSLILTTGLFAGGRLFNNYRLSDAGLHATEAVILSGLTTSILKGVVGRARPYVESTDPGEPGPDPDQFRLGRGFGQDYSSFPSGHTTVAFAAASALTRELFESKSHAAWVAGPLLYGAATAVGASRMYKNKHWASDVIAGAAVGTFIGNKLVGYKHAHGNNRFERLLLPNVVTPSTTGARLGWQISLR